jgi:hypothetical protein
VDASSQRLLESIGAAELDYYSAGEERALKEALRSWPLLAAVARALEARDAAEELRDTPLRVVAPAAEPIDADEMIEEADDERSPSQEVP